MAYPPPPYADAVCGTHVCGEAICGTWWAYPLTTGLGYGTNAPVVDIVEGGTLVPSAGLGLGATPPGLIAGASLIPPSAGLGLGATAPAIVSTSTLLVPSAGLGFGATRPDSAGAAWMYEIPCLDDVLLADTETELVLALATSSDVDLDPEECL